MIIGKAISPFALRKKTNGGGGTDADAQAFITATGITGTNATATNKLVIDLKSANIWTKMKAIYPFVGSTSASQKYNLKDARDLDIAYRLAFFGGGTFSSNGYQPGGVNGFANTFFNPSAITNNNHISYYSRTNVAEDRLEIGTIALAGQSFSIAFRAIGNTCNAGNHLITSFMSTANTSSLGLAINTRTTSTNFKLYVNNLLKATNTTAGTSAISFNIYLGARNNNNVAEFFSSKECAFASIGDGLTDAEALALYNAVQTFNTTLARQV